MKEKEEDLIQGAINIEEATGVACEVLRFHWKSAYDFPIKKVNGFPALSRKEYQEWRRFWGVENIPPGKLSNGILEKSAREKRIAAMPNTLLNGIDEIKKATNQQGHDIIDWIKNFDDCPIEKVDGTFGKLRVKKRDLIQFLERNGLRWGFYMGESTR